MVNVSITIILFLLIIAGAIVLQIFLSKKENKWPGLILPLITFCFSLLAILGIAVFTSQTATQQTITESGEVVERIIDSSPKEPIMDTASLVFTVAATFLLYNIPTAVLMAIYAACRGKRKRKLALEKMSVQDLE